MPVSSLCACTRSGFLSVADQIEEGLVDPSIGGEFGMEVAAMTLPCRTATGSLPSVAMTSTSRPMRSIFGARMKTISRGEFSVGEEGSLWLPSVSFPSFAGFSSPKRSLPSRMELSIWRP